MKEDERLLELTSAEYRDPAKERVRMERRFGVVGFVIGVAALGLVYYATGPWEDWTDFALIAGIGACTGGMAMLAWGHIKA